MGLHWGCPYKLRCKARCNLRVAPRKAPPENAQLCKSGPFREWSAGRREDDAGPRRTESFSED
eukprot:14951209-Alexandrium_andersonii.AAC.1